MPNIGKNEKLLVIGLVGLSILMAAAYFNPILLQNTSLNDLTLNGLVIKISAVLSFIGFFAFSNKTPKTYKKLAPNILRVIYIILFAVISFCSESNWECFT